MPRLKTRPLARDRRKRPLQRGSAKLGVETSPTDKRARTRAETYHRGFTPTKDTEHGVITPADMRTANASIAAGNRAKALKKIADEKERKRVESLNPQEMAKEMLERGEITQAHYDALWVSADTKPKPQPEPPAKEPPAKDAGDENPPKSGDPAPETKENASDAGKENANERAPLNPNAERPPAPPE